MSLMGNGWSNNQRMISQSPMKHKNYFDPTSHCEIKSAQPSPRGTHSPGGRKSITSRKNLHLPIYKTEGRDEAADHNLHLWFCALCCSGSVWPGGTVCFWSRSLSAAPTCLTLESAEGLTCPCHHQGKQSSATCLCNRLYMAQSLFAGK